MPEELSSLPGAASELPPQLKTPEVRDWLDGQISRRQFLKFALTGIGTLFGYEVLRGLGIVDIQQAMSKIDETMTAESKVYREIMEGERGIVVRPLELGPAQNRWDALLMQPNMEMTMTVYDGVPMEQHLSVDREVPVTVSNRVCHLKYEPPTLQELHPRVEIVVEGSDKKIYMAWRKKTYTMTNSYDVVNTPMDNGTQKIQRTPLTYGKYTTEGYFAVDENGALLRNYPAAEMYWGDGTPDVLAALMSMRQPGESGGVADVVLAVSSDSNTGKILKLSVPCLPGENSDSCGNSWGAQLLLRRDNDFYGSTPIKTGLKYLGERPKSVFRAISSPNQTTTVIEENIPIGPAK